MTTGSRDRANVPLIIIIIIIIIDTGWTLRSKAIINSDSELSAILLALSNSSKFKPFEVKFKKEEALFYAPLRSP